MKAYIAERDWADEGDIFFFSIEDEERLQALKELLNLYEELELWRTEDMYWGTNEYFEFEGSDFIEFIDDAKDITDKELAVFNKFNVRGFDIYERIADTLLGWLAVHEYECGVGYKYYVPEWITQEDLDRIKPVFLKIYDQSDWNEVQTLFNKQQ